MDVKTLSAMLGHVSAATTLDIYTHVTDDMQMEAAVRIDRGLDNEVEEAAPSEEPLMTGFQPVKGRIRRPGTGVSPRSTTTGLRAATLPPGRTASAMPKMSMRRRGRSARRSWMH